MNKLILVSAFFLASLAANSETLSLSLHCLIQGYYTSNGQMTAAAFNQGCPWGGPEVTDRVLIQLRKAGAPYSIVGQTIAILPTNGQVNCNISHPNLKSGSYYIVVKNTRNALETWSKNPVSFVSGEITMYDFTTSASQAYGDNMAEVIDPISGASFFCFYSGDVNQDGNIDLIDEAQMINGVENFASGCVTTDLNGDGNVDLLDLAIFYLNPLSLFLHVERP